MLFQGNESEGYFKDLKAAEDLLNGQGIRKTHAWMASGKVRILCLFCSLEEQSIHEIFFRLTIKWGKNTISFW